MTGNHSGHSLRPDIGFFGTTRLGKYPGKYRGKYLFLSVFNETWGFSYYLGLTIIIPGLKRDN